MVKQKKKPWVAGLLSFLVVGMGQVYNRQPKLYSISLVIIGIFLSFLTFISAWTYLILIPLWIYAIYDAYKVAKKTISKEPNRDAIWITVIILLIIFLPVFWTGFWAGFWSAYYSSLR